MKAVIQPSGKITRAGAYDILLREYLGQPCDRFAMSSSDARVLSLSNGTPAHVQAEWAEERESERKADFGSAVHALILEPFRAESDIVVIDAPDFRKKDAQAARDAATAQYKIPLLVKDFERAEAAAEAVFADPDAGPLFKKGGAPERSLLAKIDALDIYAKARPDFITAGEIIIDVKTVGNVEEEFIKRRIWEGGWFHQAPWHAHTYERVYRQPAADYLWVCVEQEEPHSVLLIRPPEAALMHGAALNERAMQIFARCAQADDWPKLRSGVRNYGLPDFVYARLEAEALARESKGTEALRLAHELNANPFG